MDKKTILFIVDKPDWAYEFMVKSWLEYLIPDYDCYLAYQQDYPLKEFNGSSWNKFIFNLKSQLVFNFKKIKGKNSYQNFIENNYYFRKYTSQPLYKFSDKDGNKKIENNSHQTFDFKFEMAFYFQYISEMPFQAKKNIVGIFTDSFPHDGPGYDLKQKADRNLLNRNQFYKKYLENYDHIIVGGGNLLADYKKITDRVSYVYGIYGERNFIENNSVGNKDYITIGWTGTPDRPMKGFREIIEPAIENVKKTGRDIRLKTKFSGPYEELYSFYKDVDFTIIASSADSGPSLFAEASLSNVPSISTKVGLPLLGIRHNVNGLFIERNIQSLENAIIELYDNRDTLKMFSSRIKSDYLQELGNEKSVQNVLQILKQE